MTVRACRRSRGGFTLAELLIAMAVFAFLLFALSLLFGRIRQSYDVSEEVAARQQLTQGAIQNLTYEIGLAGYRGTNACGATPVDCFDVNDFGGSSSLVITRNAGAPDSVVARYYEDSERLFDGSTTSSLQAVTYTVDATTNRLTRNGAVVVEGVTGFEVVSFTTRSNTEITGTPTATELGEIAAITIDLSLVDGSVVNVLIGINNELQAVVN